MDIPYGLNESANAFTSSFAGSFTLAIQAGGESRRMGKTKATVPFLGKPLISYPLSRLGPLADEILVTVNSQDRLESLPVEFPQYALRLVSDRLPERGALAGLYTALSAASWNTVALVACDMVWASPSLLALERRLMAENDVDLVLPMCGGYEPFHALYRRDPALAAVEKALKRGDRRMLSIIDDLRVFVIDEERLRAESIDPLCFSNVNTPEELTKEEERARHFGQRNCSLDSNSLGDKSLNDFPDNNTPDDNPL